MHTFLKPHNCPIDSGTRVDSRFQEPFAEVCGVSSCLWPHSHIGHRLAWNEHAHFTDTERHNKCNKNENSPEWIDQQKYNKIKSHSLYHFGWCSRCAADYWKGSSESKMKGQISVFMILPLLFYFCSLARLVKSRLSLRWAAFVPSIPCIVKRLHQPVVRCNSCATYASNRGVIFNNGLIDKLLGDGNCFIA